MQYAIDTSGTLEQMVKSLELLKGLPGATQYMLSPQVDQ
jgi:hypothetical protein